MAVLHARSTVEQVVAQVIAWLLWLISTLCLKQNVIATFENCEVVNHAAALGQASWLLDQLEKQIKPKALVRFRQHQQRGDWVPRLITLWSTVALSAAIGVLPLTSRVQLRRDS